MLLFIIRDKSKVAFKFKRSIHNWGIQKECLIEEWLQKTTLKFCLFYIITIAMD